MFEDDFITGAEMLIKEIGAREYLRYLLENLKGNDISADNGIVTAKRYLSSDE